jgi:hypothetical protein
MNTHNARDCCLNGAGADYSYDTAGRLLYVDNQTNNGQHKYAYTYDDVWGELKEGRRGVTSCISKFL